MTTQGDPVADATARALAEEGRLVRNFIASHRSDTLLRIFDFLLQQSIEGRRPKETDIAEDVFGEGRIAPGQQGARVRVGVYRLRKKLDQFYATSQGARLTIPQGEYAVLLQTREPLNEGTKVPEEQPVARSRAYPMWGVIVLLCVLNAIGAIAYFGQRPTAHDPLSVSPLWSPFTGDETPTFLVMGDYFMFTSKPNQSSEEEIVQDFSIDSPDAFYDYLMRHPEMKGTIKDQNLFAISADILAPISHLSSYLRTITINPTTSSQLDATMMKSSSVVYVGALDALSPWLTGPLFRASGFRCSARCYEIADKASGRRFLSDSPYMLGDGIVPRRDYGYIASFPGPSGHQILVVSGTGDAGVTQMASVVTNPKMVEQLRSRLGGNMRSFEALYQVRTMFGQSYGSTLLLARPIDADGIWDRAKSDR